MKHILQLVLLASVLIWFTKSNLSAQDLHYSQFFNAPLNINPALTGAFAGDMRVTGNYKSQWRSVPVDYNTFSIGIEKKLNNPFSVGLQLNYDKAGDLDLSLGSLGGFATYRIKLKEKHLLYPGVGLSINQRRIDFSNAQTENQWTGFDFDDNIPSEFMPFNNNAFFDVSVGANYRYVTSYRNYINAGIGVFHLNRPNQSFSTSGNTDEVDISRRYSLYGNASLELTSKLDLLVNILFQNQSPYREFLINAQGKLYLNKNNERNRAVLLGLGLRTQDAIYPMIGLQYDNIVASLSYDVNYSSIDFITANKGGFELSVIYQLFKVPFSPFKPCPIY